MDFAQVPAQTNLRARNIQAISLVRRMIGCSRAGLVEASDGNLYVVKTCGNSRHPNTVANEFLGYSLCAAVGLPVPVSRPIELTRSFLDRFPFLCSYEGYTYRPEPGLHFASQMLQPSSNEAFKIEFLAPNQVGFVNNRSDFLGMYILDICVKHRDARQAIFLKAKSSPESRAVFIDHGHMFGGSNWDFEGPLRLPCHTNIALYHGLRKRKDVNSWIRAFCLKLPCAIDSAVKYLPSEWYTGDLASLQMWLHHRIDSLPGFIHDELERAQIFRERLDAAMYIQGSRVCQVGA